MDAQNVVAFFPSIASAENARARLIQSGVERAAIRLSEEPGSSRSTKAKKTSDEDIGFFEWLFGTDVPEHERGWYDENLRDGRAALSVRLESQESLSRIEEILESEGAIEVERDDTAASGAMATASGATGSRRTSKAKSSDAGTSTDDEVIPIVKEELAVGKRAHETRRRVRAYVVERPVQEQVQLQDETVIVERRPVSGGRKAQAGDLQEREFEVIERHEEPVVEKRAEAVEEVVVKKNVRNRTETVTDKVRETKVDVEGSTSPKKSTKKL
jgi:stress response protein YsnF